MFKRFESLTEAFPKDGVETPPNTLFAFCLHYSRAFIVPIVLMAFLSAAIAIVEVMLMSFMGNLVDMLASHTPETLWQAEGGRIILMGLVILVVIPSLGIFHSMLMHQSLLGNFPMSIRWRVHRYLLNQSVAFYQDDFAGRIATKVMQTSLAVRETVMKLADVLVYILVYFISMLILMGKSDVWLMLPMIVWLCGYIALQYYFVPKMQKVATDQADARSLMTGRIVDSYTNILTVKLFSHTNREVKYAEKSMNAFLKTVYSQMRLATVFLFSIDVLNYLLLFSLAALSIGLWMYEMVSLGVIAVSISLAMRMQGISKWIMWEISIIFENIGTVVDGMNTLSKPIHVQDLPDAPCLQIKQGKIEFKEVEFHYNQVNQSIIKKLNLTIHPGEKVGLVGRSGAGKSTLVNLLLRFYDVESGEIKIDGQNIAKVQQNSLRHHIGVITQDTSLLHRSIRENIIYGCPEATEEALLQATKQAQADEFIQTLVDVHGNVGYEAQVGERGVKLSGGQRQRIAIARVLLKNAPILVMDEATSALDSEVEAAIQENLYDLMQGKTVIAIAHRLSTIAAMDRLIVLDEGEIVEQGTHQELIQQEGVYAQLWKHQTGGFIE